MPGLQLYQTELDELELVRTAFEEGCWLVPDHRYELPDPGNLRTMGEFRDARAAQRHFFVLHESFLKSPIAMRRIEKENELFYYVTPGVGGPALEFLGGGFTTDNVTGERRIVSGFLESSRVYWAPDLSQKLSSPPELDGMFRRLARVVKAQSTRIKPGKAVFWLGNDARLQMEGGARLVGFESWSLG